MAHLLSALILLLLLIPGQATATGEPYIDLDGWSKGTDGTYTQKFGSSTVTLTSAPKGITTTSMALVPTSKGTFELPISKTATVDTARLGANVASFAKKVGPLGMALTAADLVCTLSNICNQAGQWMMAGSDPLPGQPNSYPATDGKWWGWNSSYYSTVEGACSDPARLAANVGTGYVFDHSEIVTADTYKCYARRLSDSLVFYASNATRSSGCASQYTLVGTDCVKDGVTQSHVATDSDWTSKQSLLNDDRFTPHLLDASEALPVGLPVTPAGQTLKIGQQSTPVRDASGNVTGRDDSVTTIEAVDAATAEAPGRVIVKETTTTTRYDNNNTVINTSTSTSYSATPTESKPQNYEIKYDTVAPAELSTYQIPNTFTNTSWGSGTCPSDITVVTSIKTFAIPSQPICTAAEMLHPFVLLLATITGIFIISGVRTSEPA